MLFEHDRPPSPDWKSLWLRRPCRAPFGEVSRNTGNYSTDKRFTGKIWDESSALSYFGARYYDPELGRFITSDPTIQHPFDPQDLNRYSYCRNNPINYVDPTGYSWWSSFWNWITSGIGAIIASVAIIAVTAVANVFTGGALTPVLVGEIFGAIGGAAGAAATGGDIGRGMLIGTVVGGITGGVMGQMSAAAGAEGGGAGGAAAGGTTAGSVITSDVATWSITSASVSAPAVASNASINAWIPIIASGAGRAASAVINGMVSTAYAAENSSTSSAGNSASSMQIEVGSRPVFGQYRHKFIRWKESGSDTYTYWQMGPDRNGNISINPPGTARDTINYVNNKPQAIKWLTTSVNRTLFKQSMANYAATWVGSNYYGTYSVSPFKNSNYAVDYVVYGSGGDMSGDLGSTPGGL